MLMQIQCDGVSELKKVRDALTERGLPFQETEGMRLILTPCVAGVLKAIQDSRDVCPACLARHKKITDAQERIADSFKILIDTWFETITGRLGAERFLWRLINDELENLRPDRGEEIPF